MSLSNSKTLQYWINWLYVPSRHCCFQYCPCFHSNFHVKWIFVSEQQSGRKGQSVKNKAHSLITSSRNKTFFYADCADPSCCCHRCFLTISLLSERKCNCSSSRLQSFLMSAKHCVSEEWRGNKLHSEQTGSILSNTHNGLKQKHFKK